MRIGLRFVALAVAVLATGGLLGAQEKAGPAPGETLSQSYRGSQARNVEYQKIAPFKVMDNLYYVGPGTVAVNTSCSRTGTSITSAARTRSRRCRARASRCRPPTGISC